MAGTTLRFISERKQGEGRGRGLRWLALLLGVVAVVAAYLVFSRDVDWRTRNLDEKGLGETAYSNGNYMVARQHLLSAIANDPYDWEAHYQLASIMNRRLNDHEGALKHYLLALAYSPESSIVEPVRREISILRLIRSGELENPLEAIEDMFQCIESNARHTFMRRLELRLRRDGSAYWDGWRLRGRGKITGVTITSNHDGLYDAAIELQFPDQTSMLLHLQCPLRDIWRINLSFP